MPEHIPSDEMYKYIDCRYTGVVVAAKRARQLMQEDPTSAKGKPLLRAFDELMTGKLHYEFTEPPEDEEPLIGDDFDPSEADEDLLGTAYRFDGDDENVEAEVEAEEEEERKEEEEKEKDENVEPEAQG